MQFRTHPWQDDPVLRLDDIDEDAEDLEDDDREADDEDE